MTQFSKFLLTIGRLTAVVLIAALALWVYLYLSESDVDDIAPLLDLDADNIIDSDRKMVHSLDLVSIPGEEQHLPKESDNAVPVESLALEAVPQFNLPELNNSDALVHSEFADLSSKDGLDKWMGSAHLIRKFVLLVDNISRGSIPRKQLAFWAPNGKFLTKDNGDQSYSIDPKSYHRYNIYADTMDSLDIGASMRTYKLFKPLFDQAYQELGYPNADFSRVLLTAITHLLSTPQINGRIELTRPSVMYKFADQNSEALSAAQKQLLRMGPRNIRIIKQNLAGYRGILNQQLRVE